MHQQLSNQSEYQTEWSLSQGNRTKGMTIKQQKRIYDDLIQSFQILSNPSPSKKQLQIAHQLIDVYLHYDGILQFLLKLLQKFNLQNQTISKLIITQIFSYLKSHSHNNKKSSSHQHNIYKINETLLGFFIYSSKVDVKFKKMLQNCYMQFLFYVHNTKLREDTVKFVQNKWNQILSKSEKNLDKMKQYNKFTSPIEMFLPDDTIANQNSLILAYNMIHVLRVLFQGGSLEIGLMKKYSLLFSDLDVRKIR